MQCPRCGLENLATAEHCVRCGMPLPGFAADRPWTRDTGRERAYGAERPVPPPQPPASNEGASWLASALRGNSIPPEDEPNGAISGNFLPPWLSNPNPGNPNPGSPPSRTSDSDIQGWPGSPSDSFAAGGSLRSELLGLGGSYAGQAQPQGGPSRPFPVPSRALSRRNNSDASLGLPGAVQPSLAAGAALKAGRYRVLQPFQPAPQYRPLGDEPPLVVALDGNLSGGRVLIQELPVQRMLTDGGDQVRRLVVNRLQSLAQASVTPKLADSFSEGGRHFLVFELPTGETLLDRLHRARGPLDEATAIRYALQILDALAAMERQQPPVIHGNLSPANVVLRPSGNAILVDQSSVLLLPPTLASMSPNMGGIPGYAAPEQSRGTATTRSDLYAVCAILQHLVTGVAPQPRANWMHPPARRQNPNVSLELEEVLGKGLRPSATQRYGSVAELRAALEPLAAGHRTLVPEDLRDSGASQQLTPYRDARGRLVMPRRQAQQRPLVLIGIVLLVLLGLGAGAFYATMPRGNTPGASNAPTPNGIAAAYQARGIGVSGGELIFDTNRPSANAKQTGARAVSANDIQGALAAYRQAESADPSDAEAAIYAENMSILAANQPYVTLLVGVAYGADDAAADSELQGVFLAQHRINRTNSLPNGVQVRVEIVNSGKALSDVAVVCSFLASQMKQGNSQHYIGLVGWPRTDETQAALGLLKATGLAVVSPTSTGDNIAGVGAQYFPLVPSDSQQGAELTDAAVTALGAQRVLVLSDDQDATSSHTSQGFLARYQSAYADALNVSTANYTSGADAHFEAVVSVANARHDDLIFLACGGSCDLDTALLAQAVADQVWWNGTPAKILVDSHGFSPALVGLADGTTATQIVRKQPTILANVYVTFMAERDQWAQLEKDEGTIWPTLPDDYGAQFDPENADPTGLPEPDATTILGFDAAHILLAAGGRALQALGGAPDKLDATKVRNYLLEYTDAKPFMGVSGAIGFGPTGLLSKKALVIESLLPVQGTPREGRPWVNPNWYAGVGGQALFCGAAPGCKPS